MVFIVACLASAYALSGIQSRELAQRRLLGIIELGETDWNLRSRDGCVGNLTLSVKQDELLVVVLRGRLRLRSVLGDQEVDLLLSGVFNQLGQLFRSRLRVRASAGTLEVSSETINPLRFAIELKNPKFQLNHTLSVAGPVTVVADPSRDSLAIFGPGDGASMTPISALEAKNIFAGLELEEVGSGTEACSSAETLKAFDLQQSLAALVGKFPMLKEWGGAVQNSN